MRMKKTGILAGIMATCICIAQSVPAFGAQQDLVGFVPSEGNQTETQVKSYLTGESVPESIGRRRPVAVMMGNNISGAPQSGIGHAGVVYEAPVEGNITRLMGILEDYDELERIGSVRSCRDYYLFYANEFQAIYAHYGQAAYALPYLEQHVIDNLNGFRWEIWRFSEQQTEKPPTMPIPMQLIFRQELMPWDTVRNIRKTIPAIIYLRKMERKQFRMELLRQL